MPSNCLAKVCTGFFLIYFRFALLRSFFSSLSLSLPLLSLFLSLIACLSSCSKEKFIGKRRKGLAELRQKAFDVLREGS